MRTVLAVVAIVVGLGGMMAWFVWERCGFRGCPDVSVVRDYTPDEASVILDRNGQELGHFQIERRELVELEDLPEHVPAAFIAAEDRRFWQHEGVDLWRVVGAAWTNVAARQVQEGSSTISMQLARSIFPEELPTRDRTLRRKLAEVRVAMEIERRHNKREILELYLNQIYFGSGAWGIETAAKEYFGKPAAELTLGEAALLAGIITAPSRSNPRRDMDAALQERARVLNNVEEAGLAPPGAVQTAREEEIVLADSRLELGPSAQYFIEEVRQELDKFGVALYTGGYRIHTTLDPGVQLAAEEELARQLEAIESGRYGGFRHARYDPNAEADSGPDVLQGAVVVMDTENGDVLAMVGGRDFQQSKFNRATQARRQPGSAFKPLVYATAVGAGLPPVHPLDDSPLQLVLDGGVVWTPSNYGGGYAGVVSMRDALVHSRNIPTVRLAQEVGLDNVLKTARKLGIESPIPEVPSVSIGAAEVGILELTAAYTPFATLGERVEPRLITRVEDRDGRVVWEREPRKERVLDPAVAFIVTDMLRDVVDRGTGAGVRASYRGTAAGKTGTTNDNADVWFIGYTPGRVAGVWIGFDSRRSLVASATGGGLAAPVWARIMSRAAGSEKDWTPPSGVERRSAGADCPEAADDYFLPGTDAAGGCVAPRDVLPDTLATDTLDTADSPGQREDSAPRQPRDPTPDPDEQASESSRRRPEAEDRSSRRPRPAPPPDTAPTPRDRSRTPVDTIAGP